MSERLKAKVALISGGASGIAAACAACFVAQGARVLLGDIDVDRGQTLARDLNSEAEASARFKQLDVTRSGDWHRAVAAAEEAFGRLDILVSNAGICSMPGLLEEARGYAGPHRCGEPDRPLARNARRSARAGACRRRLYRSCLVDLGQGGGGRRHSLSSHQGRRRAAGRQLIRVNVLLPGIIDTPFLTVLVPEQRAASAELSLMKREGRPGEIARALTYLASDEPSYVTGAEPVVDGGYTTC